MIAIANKTRDHPHISHSQVGTYSNCPLKWKLSRTYKPAYTSVCMVTGRAVHKALEAFYTAILEGRHANHDDLMKVYDAEVTAEDLPIKYGKRETAESVRETVANMLDVFLREVEPGEVIAVEQEIGCELAPGMRFVGYIDLIERKDDALWIVDLKTAGKNNTTPEPDQLLLYCECIKRTKLLDDFGLPIKLRYDILTKLKSPSLTSVEIAPTSHHIERAIERMRQTYKAMNLDLVYPNPGWMCAGCGYQEHCAKWPLEKEEI